MSNYKKPIPKLSIVIALGSIYFFVKAIGNLSERDYDAGLMQLFSGFLMLFAAYSFYRN